MTTYLQFSQVIPKLTDTEVAWLITYVEHRHRGFDVDGNEYDFDDDETFPSFGFKILVDAKLGQYAWFFAAQKGDIAQVAETAQAFLQAQRPSSFFTLTWADYADNLKPEQFDGGALFVTPQDIKIFHAGEWVREQERFFGSSAHPQQSTI